MQSPSYRRGVGKAAKSAAPPPLTRFGRPPILNCALPSVRGDRVLRPPKSPNMRITARLDGLPVGAGLLEFDPRRESGTISNESARSAGQDGSRR